MLMSVLLPDADDKGWKHMTDIAASLVGVAKRIRIIVLPGLEPKGDIVDWLGSGHTREEFDALVEGAQDWAPSSPTEEPQPLTDEAKAKAAAEEQKLLDELSRLNALEYERRRREASRQLGIRCGALDDEVEARRAQRRRKRVHRPCRAAGSSSRGPSPSIRATSSLRLSRA